MEKKIKAINLSAQLRPIRKEIDRAVERVLDSGWFLLGTELENFEREFASYIGTKYAVGVASGTDALTLSIKALGLDPNDGVVVPTNVYPTVFGVALSGARVELCDIDPKTLNISLQSIKSAISRNTRAVIAVHLYGNPVDLAPLLDFCKKNSLYLIEDCAQAHGATYKDRKVGTFGDISCFSFYPTKNLGTYGDGGMVLTNNRKYAQVLKRLRMYGEISRYKSVHVGHNSRLDEIHAAILRVKIKYLDKWNARRRKIADLYKTLLKDSPVEILDEVPNGNSVYHLFVIKPKKRNKLMVFLKENGIDTGIHYPGNIHSQKSFAHLKYKKGKFPVAEKTVKEIASLPIYPEMKDSDVRYVANTVKSFYR